MNSFMDVHTMNNKAATAISKETKQAMLNERHLVDILENQGNCCYVFW